VGRPGIRTALDRGELLLHYQPIVDLRTRKPVAAEALLRWRRADGLVAPGAFWHEADADCAVDIGRFVLDRACAQVAGWRAAGLCAEVSVNTDPRELSASWVSSVYEALATHQLPSSALNVELTETARVDPLTAADFTGALIRHGVGVSLDDAGTGFNALATVSEMPLTELKIDRAFVSRLGNPRADALVRGLVAISAELGMRTVAEGVETEEQAQLLERYGVERAQGFLFSRPLPPDAFADYWARACGPTVCAAKLIHELAASGASAATIAAVLNRRGATGPNGRSWRASTVARALAGEIATRPVARRPR
jgi:EAL domain-containing protein (putative c-di-GMP-specific phosphodiesterase class I)